MSFDFAGIASSLLSPILNFISSTLTFVFLSAVGVVVFVLAFFFIRYRFHPLRLNADALREPYIKNKYYDLFRWCLVDFLERGLHVGEFREYGFTFYVGRQGQGKTSALVHYLERMKEKYPNCIIVTNFSYYRADFIMKDWHDLLNVRNGTDGVIFAIDEIHSEYSAASWKDVPESLLAEISQQRKQRIKIVATSQFFTRIAKPLREQAGSVVICSCFLGRLIKTRTYDALEYASHTDNPTVVQRKLRPLAKASFVLSDALRSCFDTYEKIERMQKIKFIPRDQR